MKTKDILQPIMDLFTGADGGIAYLRLHEAMDEAIKQYEITGADRHHPDIQSLIEVSRICRRILKFHNYERNLQC